MGPKKGRQGLLQSLARHRRIPLPSSGLLVCWEVLLVLKARPTSPSVLCGLQVCLAFWLITSGLSHWYLGSDTCLASHIFFSESDEIKEYITLYGLVVKSTDSGITHTHV